MKFNGITFIKKYDFYKIYNGNNEDKLDYLCFHDNYIILLQERFDFSAILFYKKRMNLLTNCYINNIINFNMDLSDIIENNSVGYKFKENMIIDRDIDCNYL